MKIFGKNFSDYLANQVFLKIDSTKTNLKPERYRRVFQPRIPNLLEVQHASFFNFLKFGLRKEFQRRNTWFYAPHLEWTFYPQRLRLEVPVRNYQETLRLSRNYSTRILIPRSLYDRQNQKICFEWVVLGSLPLLTRQGHFLINGSPRVCITQIIRSPGIYTCRKIKKDRKIISYIDFVPERGTWVRVEKDFKDQVWIRIRKEPSCSFWSILQTIGLFSFFSHFSWNHRRKKDTHDVFLTKISNDLFFFESKKKIKKKKNIKKQNSHLIFNFFQKKKAKLIYLTRKLSNLRIYDLRKIGRHRLNKRFQQALPLSVRCLLPSDLLRSLRDLNHLNKQDSFSRFDDIDSLKTRQLRAVGDLLQIEVGSTLFRLERRSRQRLDSLSKNQKCRLTQLLSTEIIDQIFRRFVAVNPLLQFANQLNPLSNLTQKRRLTRLGPGGLSLTNRKVEVRTIHSSHFGRLCPVETPEGQNARIVNSPALMRRSNPDGRLQPLILIRQNGWLQPIWVSRKRNDWITRLIIGLLTNILRQIQIQK